MLCDHSNPGLELEMVSVLRASRGMTGIEKRLGVDYHGKFVSVDILHVDAFTH